MTLAPSVDSVGTLPKHVAIIMDGNGRWAKARGQIRVQGHRAGAESVREVVETAAEIGVQYLTLYAFSVENWRRPPLEIEALMILLDHFLQAECSNLMKNNVRLQTIGRIMDLPSAVQNRLQETIRTTSLNSGLTLILALSYGGRAEITEAIRALADEARTGKLDPSQIDEATVSRYLYTKSYPDPDLLIRTSGEMRLSNFLLWQASYTELYITDTLWPDFRRDDFLKAVAEFGRRQRRFGGV